MKYKLLFFFATLFLCCPLLDAEGNQEKPVPSIFALNQTPMQQCLSAENYTLTLRYAQWKLKTAKRLSKNQRLLFGKGFEYTVQEEGNGEKSIVFYKKNVEAFAVNTQELLPLDKTSDLTKYHQLFCDLLASAKFANLPHNLVYRYHDGSNNVWSIGNQKIVYQPVTPAMSSSGIYSGGEPFEKNITAAQFTEIEALLKAGVVNKTIHEDSRLKGSGMIVELLTDALVGGTYLLPMRSAEKMAIEIWLGKLKE
ncbi:hypothetical protein [Haliscomenobacter sp.]|uniref:hypothetical protein n=1 Tax=Haliscomenobacter sp. TaxID=2717303 RepID=UPI003593471C